MARTVLCFISFMLTHVLGRVPGAYSGNTLTSIEPNPIIEPLVRYNAKYVYNQTDPKFINFTIYNNFNSPNMYMWVTGNRLDTGNVAFLLPNSTFYTPAVAQDSNGNGIGYDVGNFVAIPLPAFGQTLNLPLPGYIGSCRIFFSVGLNLVFGAVLDGNKRPAIQQPTSGQTPTQNWGYMELSYGPEGPANATTGEIIYVDISEVDFAGLPVGFALHGCENYQPQVQQVVGLNEDAVSNMCAEIKALPPPSISVPAAPWNETCVLDSAGNPLRVVSPGDVDTVPPADSRFNAFWQAHVDEVWAYYETHTLTLLDAYDTFLGNCTVVSGNLTCAPGFNRGYYKPTARDIHSCATGPFQAQVNDSYAVGISVPIISAALNRGTLLLPGGNVQPQQSPNIYYTNDINNYYSKFVHGNAYGRLGYAFPYDDVTPANETNESGTLVARGPLLLAMTVGGPVASLIPATPLSGVTCPTYPAAPAGAGGGGGSTYTGPKVFPYNPVVPAASCTVSSSAAVVTSTASPSKVAAYTYLGCWTDNNANRTLQHAMEFYSMTLESCAANATYNGYSIFGVEYMYECWADNVLNTGTSCPALAADCDMPCDGNANQTCGGPDRMNVYQIIPAAAPTTSFTSGLRTSSAVSMSAKPSNPAMTSPSTHASTTSSVFGSHQASFSPRSTSMLGLSTVPGFTSTTTSRGLITISTTSKTSPSTPLPTVTGGPPRCDSLRVGAPGDSIYRIYCNTTIAGKDLAQLTPYLGSFADCIALCSTPTYNSTCTGSVFTNSTMSSCVLKSNNSAILSSPSISSSTIGFNGTTSSTISARQRMKRDNAPAVVYESQVFAAYRLVNPNNDQGPPDPAPSTSTTTSGLLTGQMSSASVTPPISSLPSSNVAHLVSPTDGILTAQQPSMAPSAALPTDQGDGRGTCAPKSVTVVALVTVTECPTTSMECDHQVKEARAMATSEAAVVFGAM